MESLTAEEKKSGREAICGGGGGRGAGYAAAIEMVFKHIQFQDIGENLGLKFGRPQIQVEDTDLGPKKNSNY